MHHRNLVFFLFASLGLASTVPASCATANNAGNVGLPDPSHDPAPNRPGTQTVVLAGGCFWGMQAVFEHVRGVRSVIAGYAGGAASTAHYDDVSNGDTGHAESVQISYDPQQVSFGQLLKVYFQVAHDPTELNRQGPDSGSQYRSEIYFTTPQQREEALAYIAQLNKTPLFGAPIVTKVAALPAFYPAETEHQEFARRHPENSYIITNDAPKVEALKRQLPALYRAD